MTIRTLDVPVGALMFRVDVAGDPAATKVLLLHGFPQTSYSYRHELPRLADAGYCAIAPDQRGYSPNARPAGVAAYATEHLIGDALGIADYFGAARFHLVGHDWGGQLAWLIAAYHPERVRTLTVLSRPHPAAFAHAMKADPAQAERSRHHRGFADPDTAQLLLADNAQRLRRALADQGVAAADVDAYLSRLGNQAALDAALNWYRATPSGSALLAANVPVVRVPTLYVWGDRDATVGRVAAEATAEQVSGPYQFVAIAGAGHFLTDQVDEQVIAALLTHLARNSDVD